jgi:hypothetical protein
MKSGLTLVELILYFSFLAILLVIINQSIGFYQDSVSRINDYFYEDEEMYFIAKKLHLFLTDRGVNTSNINFFINSNSELLSRYALNFIESADGVEIVLRGKYLISNLYFSYEKTEL